MVGGEQREGADQGPQGPALQVHLEDSSSAGVTESACNKIENPSSMCHRSRRAFHQRSGQERPLLLRGLQFVKSLSGVRAVGSQIELL